jgi:hypothetical protein
LLLTEKEHDLLEVVRGKRRNSQVIYGKQYWQYYFKGQSKKEISSESGRLLLIYVPFFPRRDGFTVFS